MSRLSKYRTFLVEAGQSDAIRFDCEAESVVHAVEQAENSYPGCEVVSVHRTSADVAVDGAILRGPDAEDYEIRPDFGRGSLWLSAANASLWIRIGQEDLVIEVYPRGAEDVDAAAEMTVAFDDLRPSPEVLACCQEEAKAAHATYAPTATDYWAKLADIPVNDKDELEEGFLHFEAGVHREEVWRWFEATYPGFLSGDPKGRAQPDQGRRPA